VCVWVTAVCLLVFPPLSSHAQQQQGSSGTSCSLGASRVAAINAACCDHGGHRRRHRRVQASTATCPLLTCTQGCAALLMPLTEACPAMRAQLSQLVPGFTGLLASCARMHQPPQTWRPPTPATCARVAVGGGYTHRTHCVYVPRIVSRPPLAAAGVPLIVGLHGLGSSGQELDSYLRLTALADSRGFILILPDGLTAGPVVVATDAAPIAAPGSGRYWAGTDSCCNWWEGPDEDSAYLRALILAAQAAYHVDPKRVYITGHSNGAFMAHRMACDHADIVAGIGALSCHCVPATPLSWMTYLAAPADCRIDSVTGGCDVRPLTDEAAHGISTVQLRPHCASACARDTCDRRYDGPIQRAVDR
jgi:poly(3-hydroxybutyrate) depolymerase